MNIGLTQKQETFCLKYFELGNASKAALIAGYSPRYAATHTTRWLNMANIQERLRGLRQVAEDESVATVIERKQVLTEIVRARQTDFMTCSADGVWMHDIGKESLNKASLKKIRTTTMPFGSKGSDLKIILTEVELSNPMTAIDLLNKMDKIYTPDGAVNIDNRTLNIYVNSDKAKSLTERLVEGERTE